jgi:hypothetical protein
VLFIGWIGECAHTIGAVGAGGGLSGGDGLADAGEEEQDHGGLQQGVAEE